jgi:hypothetical protein
MQVKSCFKSLLPPGTELPVLRDVDWSDLPIIQYADLNNVKIPPPTRVSKDQLVLANGLVY